MVTDDEPVIFLADDFLPSGFIADDSSVYRRFPERPMFKYVAILHHEVHAF